MFYDLCGLTLRTIFDLRIPGATTPVKGLLQLAGDSIPAQGSLCPQLTAVKSAISQGFGCGDGEVLRQKGKDELPECCELKEEENLWWWLWCSDRDFLKRLLLKIIIINTLTTKTIVIFWRIRTACF